MNQRAMDELRHQSGMDGWMFYPWAIPSTLSAVFLAYLTSRNGIWEIVAEPSQFYLLVICLMALVSFWRARPKKQS